MAFLFDTAGIVHWEVRATGIMSITPVDLEADPADLSYGTVVGPGVFAPHHQHIFNIRCDPAIDGYRSSTIAYDEVLPFERDASNPHGVGFGTQTTYIDKEGAFDLDWNTNRTVKMINRDKVHAHAKKPIGYKIAVPPTQLGLAHVTSMHNKRGQFINHHIHVTKHDEEEMYAAGEHPWQGVGDQGGCRTWSERGRSLEKGDAVVWITIGFTHVTRAEGMSSKRYKLTADWPLMPAEVFRMHFKPVNFFQISPAVDMPPSTQAVNKSILATVSGGAQTDKKHASARGSSKCCVA